MTRFLSIAYSAAIAGAFKAMTAHHRFTAWRCRKFNHYRDFPSVEQCGRCGKFIPLHDETVR